MPRAVKPFVHAPDIPLEHDAGFVAAAERAERAVAAVPSTQVGRPIVSAAGGEVRIGTASWTDPTITRGGVFYPRGSSSAEDRLRYVARLPEALIDALPAVLAARRTLYAKDLPAELYAAVWDHFLDALEPLRAAGKLGGVLLQYPRWFLPTPENREHLAESAERLQGTPAAVELRNRHWFASGEGRGMERTLDLLRRLGLTYVMVDGPQGLESSVPGDVGITTPELAMIRLHGRRSATWEAPQVATVERYRYLYSPEELDAWVPRIELATADARRTTVFLNNCYGNYGTTNARELVAMLSR